MGFLPITQAVFQSTRLNATSQNWRVWAIIDTEGWGKSFQAFLMSLLAISVLKSSELWLGSLSIPAVVLWHEDRGTLIGVKCSSEFILNTRVAWQWVIPWREAVRPAKSLKISTANMVLRGFPLFLIHQFVWFCNGNGGGYLTAPGSC